MIDGIDILTPELAEGDIEFHNVYFRYTSSTSIKWVLNNFCLKIKAGQSIGIVGESGSGKSTLLQLLYRFYDPQQGHITISGVPIINFTLCSLRQQFGIVQQEPVLFNSSILDNILYGKPHATVDEVRLAAKLANATEFIEKDYSPSGVPDGEYLAEIESDPRYSQLPIGYRNILGPKGHKLSGGQRQRVAIARAIIRTPKVLMFDEATAALDEGSQEKVQETLEEIMHKSTCIVIAHRVSAIKNCDRVVTLVDGVSI